MIMYEAKEFYEDIFELRKQVNIGVRQTAFNLRYVYGIPRGGVPVAIAMANALGLSVISSLDDIPINQVLVVDDLVDSGRTLQKYVDAGYTTVVLHHKSHSPTFKNHFFAKQLSTEWIQYFWELSNKSEDPEADVVVRLLEMAGEDPTREGLLETPKRFLKAWQFLTSGYQQKVEDIIKCFDSDGYNQIVLLKDIEVFSLCEHHLMSFWGKAHVAYIPGKKVVGISKLARIVDIFARRLQIQERLGDQVVKALMEHLKPIGAACIIEATHLCMRQRGVQKQNSVMTTSSLAGVFLEDSTKGASARAELMRLIGK